MDLKEARDSFACYQNSTVMISRDLMTAAPEPIHHILPACKRFHQYLKPTILVQASPNDIMC
ncbi:hypothetical protein FRX31_009371 [Thalictrum thalictroides]|uniref:Uncharacterized protein n=1 Tax=Thalictrum thalictroides TaxID=46969 RepID=A0A7J6WVG4_THATH|nr:hypothetical protein FRX31_009371 [Thalictrum thalictroides]